MREWHSFAFPVRKGCKAAGDAVQEKVRVLPQTATLL